jgi:hypothetical protein
MTIPTPETRKDGKSFARFDMLPSRAGTRAKVDELQALLNSKGGRPWRIADVVAQAVTNELERVRGESTT